MWYVRRVVWETIFPEGVLIASGKLMVEASSLQKAENEFSALAAQLGWGAEVGFGQISTPFETRAAAERA